MFVYKDGQVAHYKSVFPNTSFPASGPSAEFLAEAGAYVVSVFKPYDQATQKLVGCEPYIEDGFAYTVAVEAKTPEEILAETESRAAKVRAERDRRLSASDWTQVLDAPVDRTAWVLYRQALRDLPEQPGFPDVDFPETP